jgi:DNA-binding GntR family transcriptional regulator
MAALRPGPEETMTVGAAPSGHAKHASIARALADDIEAGRYPVGSGLPSEAELTGRFSVSRHTVRTALRTLQEMGLITAHAGIGSVVRAVHAEARYTQSFGSVADLLQYTRTTRFDTVERGERIADDAFVAQYGGQAGEPWLHLRIVRRPMDSDIPLTVADVFVPRAIGLALGDFPSEGTPIFEQIRALGEPIVRIEQRIAAQMPSADEARRLRTPADRPVLVILRRYHGENGRLLEVTRTVHPGDAFTYRMDLRLTSGRLA